MQDSLLGLLASAKTELQAAQAALANEKEQTAGRKVSSEAMLAG